MLAKKMSEGKLDNETKLRLIIIASFALELNENERKQLTQSFSKPNQNVVSKLSLLGLHGERGGSRRLSQKYEGSPSPSADKIKNIPSNLCRHIPMIDSLVTEMVTNKADPGLYGSLYTTGYDGTLIAKANQKKIYQNNKEKDQKKLPKLIFFVIGGITRAEIRVLDEASKRNPNVKVLVGSTSIINAQEYLRAIEDMANGDVSLSESINSSTMAINIEDEYDL